MKKRKSLFFRTIMMLCLVCFFATSAGAAGIKTVWGGGQKKSSTYSNTYVPHLIEMLAAKRMSGYEWGGPTGGTIHNAMQVTLNPTHVAVGQYDVLKELQGKPIPGMEGKVYDFTILFENIGPESLYVVINDKNYKTWGDILGNSWDLTCVTGSNSSGHFGTYSRLAKIYPDLNDVEVEQVGGTLDIVNEIKGTQGKFGFFVMRPDPKSAVFKAIAKAGLTLVPVVDYEIEEEYGYMSLKIAGGGLFSGGEYHTTASTSVAVITGKQANIQEGSREWKRLKATIKRLKEYSNEDMTPKMGSLRDMWDNLVVTSKDRSKELMEASKKAYESHVKNQ